MFGILLRARHICDFKEMLKQRDIPPLNQH